MITEEEIRLCEYALGTTLKSGAEKARVAFVKSQEDITATLNGEVDKITHCLDRSISINVFADKRYGSFSTNKLDRNSLEDFIARSVNTVRMLAPDECRDLPDPARCAKDAVSGNELELVDDSYGSITPERRRRTALDAAIFGKEKPQGAEIVSEEGEYGDSMYDSLLLDSNGTRCRHTETSFDYGVEITVEADGDKYSGYWWDSSSRLSGLNYKDCGKTALKRALAQIGAKPVKSGRYTMVLDSEVASKVVSPLLNALNGYSIQQNNSFLMDSLGKKIFPEGMTVMDFPRIKGQAGSKMFDSEGAATAESTVIENGVVKQYFINTYMSRKLGIPTTTEDAMRPRVMPWPVSGLDRDAILKRCKEGILVTEFNGGNCNSATGDFSYGIGGFRFKDGKIAGPVSEMLVTGNFLTLWNSLLAAGDDARSCMSKLIPTLAFSNVDFSG